MIPTAIRGSLLAVVVVSTALIGCKNAESGANGRLEFIAKDCGRAGVCYFDDGIGAGGRIAVQIDAIGDIPTAGVNLLSSDPDLMEVQPTANIGSDATWEITALAAGIARLSAVDASGVEVDYLDVEILNVDAISSFNNDRDAPRGSTTTEADEGWPVETGEIVVFYVEAMSGGERTMGRFDYLVTLDPEIEDGLSDPDVESGRLAFRVPSAQGYYYASFDNQLGQQLTVVFTARSGSR